MLTPENYTLSQLAKVFILRQEEIISEWRIHAHRLLAGLNLDKETLTDHLPDIIAEITNDLAQCCDGEPPNEPTKDSSPAHGVQRFYDGLNVGQVVTEYNLLRAAFNTIAERNNYYVAGEAARIINHRIDDAVQVAVTAYAEQQAMIRKKEHSEHLAFVAHDLRTPLNAVSLMVDLLKEEIDEAARAKAGDVFDSLKRNLQRIESLIKRVLDTNLLASSQSSYFHPERRIFELWPLVQRLIQDLDAVASQHQIHVINQVPRTLTVFADAGLISQVFQNLLSNAFKYAAKGEVVVTAYETADNVTCVVRDNGTGIPLDMLEKVFDKMTTDPSQEGTGLGLAIVKQIVEAHEGEVRVESVQGTGATFSFTLPFKSN